MSEIETDDKTRLRKMSEATSLGDVRLYFEGNSFAIQYRDRGTRLCMSEGSTIEDAIDNMELDI